MPARFARLRIAGFKSFADATAIDILPGLTGIVGPNGCGKSNVVDALRWAMGEASARSLRGSEMDDVIFAGTIGRPARAFAEVAITLTETAGHAPAPFQAETELQIVRKIVRGSGSAYRINGRESRARDVATLFADLASGARNSAMISQGRVSALVSARPEERRAILEEAAGITGLHSRRHEAELKLRATEQNLARAEDGRVQQEQRLGDLQKQARQANRYRAISGLIREAETQYLAIENSMAVERRDAARAALDTVRETLAGAQSALRDALAAEIGGVGEIPALRDREAAMRTALERARIHFEQIEAEIARNVKARSEADAQLAAITRDHQHAERIGGDAEAACARLAQEQEQRTREGRDGPDRLDAAETAARDAAGALEQAEASVQRATETNARHNAIRESVDQRLAAARSRASQTGARAAEAATALNRAREALIAPDRLDAAQNAAAEAVSACARAEAAHGEAQNAVVAAELAQIEITARATAARTAAIATEATASRLRAETDALTAMLAQKFGRDSNPVLDRIQVPDGLEIALGAALRDELAASTDAGGARHWRSLPALVPETAELTRLSDLIAAPEALRRALDHILLLPDDADGAALQTQLGAGQLLVSRAGAVWRWDGFVTIAGAPTEAAVRLAQRNRLVILRRELELASHAASASKAARTEADAAEQAARKAETDARAARKAAESALERARSELRSRNETASRLAVEAERLAARELAAREASERLNAEHDDARTAMAAVQHEADAQPDVTALRADLDRARAQLGQARAADAAAQQTIQRLIGEAAERDRRLAVIAREIADWTERARDAGQRRTDLAARLREAEQVLASLADQAASDDVRATAATARDEADAHHRDAAQTLDAAERAIRQSATAARAAEQHMAHTREALILAESELREADHAWGSVAERILERLGVDAEIPAIEAASAEAADKARRRFERLTRERDEMGPVNLRADIEVNEIETRLAAIVRERDEIAHAIAKLRGSIGHLNREGRERLSAVFTEIDRHFQALFSRMFGGGRAHLALTGSDDPLEAGLEIFAEPPGKKLATLSLLSGGEQALTALSLIFAVFRCNPAPISVLDEVDAPLDDANVDRFCTLLDDMARETGTRFLVVTHHHLTMARMDRLYGVTMQERGISRVLSVDLGTASAMVDTQAAIAAE